MELEEETESRRRDHYYFNTYFEKFMLSTERKYLDRYLVKIIQ